MWDILKNKVSNFISKIKGEEEKESEKELEEIDRDKNKIDREIRDEDIKNKVNEDRKEEKTEEEGKEEEIEKKEKTKEEGKKWRRNIEIENERSNKKLDHNIKSKSHSGNYNILEKDIKNKKRKNLVGIKGHLSRLLFKKIKLDKSKIDDLTFELELDLIQSDVHPDLATHLCEQLRDALISHEFSDPEKEIKEVIKDVFYKETFADMPSFDILEFVKGCSKPCKILFVGPNGAGKTTTIAKIAYMLKKHNFIPVISASDTFRAAAIEQAEEHGNRLGIKVIRHQYGADAAAVAYDAINHAKATNKDVVLIDSAGRQETNQNLMRELSKIIRIIKPDLVIMVAESTAGNNLYQQVENYNKIVKIDGIILTKIDCDAKGGAALSIYKETKIPIIYLGRGQKYENLEKFDPKMILDEIIG